jgi:A/G-specific adenine glycosylase
MTIKRFQSHILEWYKKNRRDMPWRSTKDPYKILVSEIMLQQTQISRVLPKYMEFLKTFPSLEDLANAPDKKLMKVWAGLGYWRRAKYLKQTAQLITYNYQQKFPRNPGELEKLPGIGHYTARALACFAFNNKEAFLDTNIRRVYLHFFFLSKKNVSDKQILKIAQRAVDSLPKNISPREWHYALFDYGATVLKDKKINKRSTHYHKQSKFEGSFRSFRTKAVRFLLTQPRNRAFKRALANFLKKELQQSNAPYLPEDIIAAVVKDKLIKKSQRFYSL